VYFSLKLGQTFFKKMDLLDLVKILIENGVFDINSGRTWFDFLVFIKSNSMINKYNFMAVLISLTWQVCKCFLKIKNTSNIWKKKT